MNRQLLVAYAAAYASYLLRDTDAGKADVRAIYLYGSVARGDFDRDSDVDIFVDMRGDGRFVERALKRFLASEERKKFRLLGIDNELNPHWGKMDEWELKESVEKDGVVLYAASIVPGLRPLFLITLQPIQQVAKRNKVMRRLAGRQEKHFQGEGLVKELGGETVNNRVFLVPAEQVQKVLALLSAEKVTYRLKKVWM